MMGVVAEGQADLVCPKCAKLRVRAMQIGLESVPFVTCDCEDDSPGTSWWIVIGASSSLALASFTFLVMTMP